MVRHRPIQGKSNIDFLGESEGSLPQPQDSFPDAGEAKNDFWSMSGNFKNRHHVEPRVKLYSPREESFPIPLKYIDVSRTTHTNLDVKQEKHIDDYWNIDGSKDLSDSWTGFTQFTRCLSKNSHFMSTAFLLHLTALHPCFIHRTGVFTAIRNMALSLAVLPNRAQLQVMSPTIPSRYAARRSRLCSNHRASLGSTYNSGEDIVTTPGSSEVDDRPSLRMLASPLFTQKRAKGDKTPTERIEQEDKKMSLVNSTASYKLKVVFGEEVQDFQNLETRRNTEKASCNV